MDVPNYGEQLDQLLAALRSTSAATQQVAASELKSSVVQHKKELESRIVGLTSEVSNLQKLLISCLLTCDDLGHHVQGASLTQECLVNEQRHLERLKLLTLNVNGFETEVKHYYDNIQSLLAYLRRNVDAGSDDEKKTPVVDYKGSTDAPIETPGKPDILIDTQVASVVDSNMHVKRLSFATDTDNTFSDMWINPVGPWTGKLVRVERAVFAADLPVLSTIQLDDNLRSGSPLDISKGALAESTVHAPWALDRLRVPLSVHETYNISDASGTLPLQTDINKPEKTSVLVPHHSASMRESRRSISGTPRSRGVTSDSVCIGGEKTTLSRSQHTRTADVTHPIGLRLKPDRNRRRDSIFGLREPWETSLSQSSALADRANSDRCASAFDTSKRQHSMSPRASKLFHDDKEFTGKVTFMQIYASTKSVRRPNTASVLSSSHLRKWSAGLTLNDDCATVMDLSPRSPRDIVAPSRGNTWSSPQGRYYWRLEEMVIPEYILCLWIYLIIVP